MQGAEHKAWQTEHNTKQMNKKGYNMTQYCLPLTLPSPSHPMSRCVKGVGRGEIVQPKMQAFVVQTQAHRG